MSTLKTQFKLSWPIQQSIRTNMQIKKLINNDKSNVAVGHDNLPAKLIKTETSVIIEDLANLVNLSHETKILPDQLKITNTQKRR